MLVPGSHTGPTEADWKSTQCCRIGEGMDCRRRIVAARWCFILLSECFLAKGSQVARAPFHVFICIWNANAGFAGRWENKRENSFPLVVVWLPVANAQLLPVSHSSLFADVLEEKCLSCLEGQIYTGCNFESGILQCYIIYNSFFLNIMLSWYLIPCHVSTNWIPQ